MKYPPKKILILVVISMSIFSLFPLIGENLSSNLSTLTVSLSPRYDIPLFTSTEQFQNGLSGQFSLAYKPPIFFPIYVSFDLGYTYSPLKLTWANPLHRVMAGGGIGLNIRFLGRLSADLYFKGGYYESIINDLDGEILYGGNPYIDTGGGLSFYLSSAFRIGIGVSYRQFFGVPDDLLKEVGFYIGTSYRFPLTGSMEIEPTKRLLSKLKISKVKINEIFPVFYKYYDDHPIGKITVVNGENGKIDKVTVSFFITQYMDNPKIYRIKGAIRKGESREIDIFALFNEKVLNITEGAKVSSRLIISYEFRGKRKEKSVVKTILLQNRNASIWDDDRRAAAFITAREPVILRLSKNLAGIIREEPNKVLGKNFMLLNAIHNALSTYGITYVVDPKTPYKDFHEKKQAIDFLQFPRQTLEYKAGDCDDLSILYAALLEASSVDTALITVPGHIYIAVDLGITPKTAKKIFYNTEDLIIRNNRVWLPFEVTMIQENFLNAWREGAREWRRYNSTGRTGFYEVLDAWRVFEPVGLPGNANNINFPELKEIQTFFNRDIKRVINLQVENKSKNLKERIKKSGSYKLINKLGILYARYGLYKEAESQFLKILKKPTYRYVGLINIGNIRYKQGDLKGAIEYYNRARVEAADNIKLIINIARVNYKLGHFDKARKLYEEAKVISPEIVEKFQYLASGGYSGRASNGKTSTGNTVERASNTEEKGNVLWEE